MTTAVLFDSLGTLVALEDPVPRMRSDLARRGLDVDDAAIARAFGAEVAYYIEHHLEGRDQSTLAELRNRCASVFREELGVPELPPPDARDVLLGSLSFTAFADVAPTLRELRGRGLRLAVVSNWDCSLRHVLAAAGVLELVDEVIASAEVGAAKPDPAPFRAALAALGCKPGEAVHVGDREDNDVAGARAAGIRGIRIARDGGGEIASLADLAAVL